MTYYEYQDLFTGVSSQLNTLGATIFTLFIAFLVCAHFVGSKLGKFQVILITIAYSSYFLFTTYLFYGQLNRIQNISAEFFELESLPSLGFSLLVFPIYGLGWLLSVIYMYQVRRDSTK